MFDAAIGKRKAATLVVPIRRQVHPMWSCRHLSSVAWRMDEKHSVVDGLLMLIQKNEDLGRLADFAGLGFDIRFPQAFIAVHVKARGVASCSPGPPAPIQCRFVAGAMIRPCDLDVRKQNSVLNAPSIPVRAGVSENPRPGYRWISLRATVLPLDGANVVWGQRVIMFV